MEQLEFQTKLKNFQNVDFDNLQINGVSIVSLGEAKGHNAFINEAFLDKIVELGNKNKEGIKSNWGHPSNNKEALGTELGRFRNFRKIENKVFADISFIKSEINNKYIDHIFQFANNDSGMFGVSIRFESDGTKFDERSNKNIQTVSRLNGIDFVSDPAANNGLFSTKKNSQKIIKYINNKLNNIQKQLQSMQNDNNKSETTDNKSKNLLTVFQKHVEKFSASETVTGDKISYPGDKPAVGDMVVFINKEQVASEVEDGTYEMIDGSYITCIDSIITEIVPAPEREEDPLLVVENAGDVTDVVGLSANNVDENSDNLRRENNRLQAQLKAMETIQQNINFSKVKTKNNEMNLGGFDKGTQKANGKFREEYIVEMFNTIQKEKFFSAKGQGNRNFKISRNTKNHIQFSSGFDIASAIAPQFDIFGEVIYDSVAQDSILQYFTRMNGQAYMKGAVGYDMSLPLFNFEAPYPDGFELWRAQNENCEINPTGIFNAYDRQVNVVPIRYEFQVCPPELRNLWNGLVYQGEDVVPAESLVMAMLANYLTADLDRIAMFGRTQFDINSRNVVGLLTQIQLGVISGNIPAAQSITQATPYDETVAIAQLEELAYAIPDQLVGQDLSLFSSHFIQERYFQNYKASNVDSPWLQIRDAAEYGRLMNFFRANVNFQPVFAMGDASANGQITKDTTVFITKPNNIGYYLEYPAEEGAVRTYQKDDRTLVIAHTNYFGINYMLGSRIVTNITSTLPTVFAPASA